MNSWRIPFKMSRWESLKPLSGPKTASEAARSAVWGSPITHMRIALKWPACNRGPENCIWPGQPLPNSSQFGRRMRLESGSVSACTGRARPSEPAPPRRPVSNWGGPLDVSGSLTQNGCCERFGRGFCSPTGYPYPLTSPSAGVHSSPSSVSQHHPESLTTPAQSTTGSLVSRCPDEEK